MYLKQAVGKCTAYIGFEEWILQIFSQYWLEQYLKKTNIINDKSMHIRSRDNLIRFYANILKIVLNIEKIYCNGKWLIRCGEDIKTYLFKRWLLYMQCVRSPPAASSVVLEKMKLEKMKSSSYNWWLKLKWWRIDKKVNGRIKMVMYCLKGKSYEKGRWFH